MNNTKDMKDMKDVDDTLEFLRGLIKETLGNDEATVTVYDDRSIQTVLSGLALAWGVAERPTVDETWRGAGTYRFRLIVEAMIGDIGKVLDETAHWRVREPALHIRSEFVKGL